MNRSAFFPIWARAGMLAGSLMVNLPAQGRDWTDAAGRHMEGDLLGVECGKVVIGWGLKQYSMRLDSLSMPDQAYVKSWLEKKAPLEQLPPPWWPEVVQQEEIHVQGGPQADGTFKFQSKHYDFHCDSEVSPSVMTDFATVAEGTIRLLYALPVAFPPLQGKMFQARILSNRDSYYKAGGPRGSAGVFLSSGISGEGALLVPFESLGIESFLGRNTKGYDYDATVLIHEMAHQVTAELLPLMPRWLGEGLAEYAACMPYRYGVFQLGERERILALRQRLDFYEQLCRKRGMKTSINWILKPSDLVQRTDNEWLTSNHAQEAQLLLHKLYLSSMFLVHYFLHYADNNDARRIRLYFHTLNDAALYIRTKGEQGKVPASLETDSSPVTIEKIRAAFLEDLYTENELPNLDQDFRASFAKLGFRF